MIDQAPELQLLYETAPVGLAFLSPDCRYLQINRHLTEICGISVADHIGRSVRDTVPQVADQVEFIVQTILRTGEAVTGIEVSGQRPDGGNAAIFMSGCRGFPRTKPSTVSTRRLPLGMLLKILDRLDQAFGINLFLLLDFRLFH
jgi:PAS domain S-box-containing protein